MNKVTLIGNLTKDPELKTLQSGISVCNFSIAVNRRYKGQDGNPITDFFDIVVWRQLGEMCAKYLAKGRKVAVIGELQNRAYEAKDGSKRQATQIVADEVEFLTPKGSTSSTGASQQDAAYAATAPAPAYASAPSVNTGAFPDGFEEIDDDELPF